MKVTTPHGSTEYWYGAAIGHGTSEYRALPTKMVISNHGAAVTTGTTTATGDWVSWSLAYRADGKIAAEASPDGLAPELGEPDGTGAYERTYTYDHVDRLTSVTDHVSDQKRAYVFDANGNRTGLTTTSGLTTASPITSARSWAWDAADRPTGGGYAIDTLGRMTAIPAVDAPATGTTAANSGAGGAGITIAA